MEITVLPLGAGLDVGRSCILVTLGKDTVMLDCGMHVGFKDHRRFPDFSSLLKEGKLENKITCVLVTHFHLDHCGALPYLTGKVGYKGPIVMTPPTRAICPVLLEDYRKVMSDRYGAKDMYSSAMIAQCMQQVKTVNLHQPIRIGGLEITPYYAGHVLGAVAFEIRATDFVGSETSSKTTYSRGSRSVVYTGDFNMIPDRHLGCAELPANLKPDLLISESTYATTVRGSKKKREQAFLHAVEEAVARGGKVLIPVFAVGRIQELALLLEEFWAQQGICVPIYVSGGLAAKAHEYYKLFADWTHPELKTAFADYVTREGRGGRGGGAGGEGEGRDGGSGKLAGSAMDFKHVEVSYDPYFLYSPNLPEPYSAVV
jgi:integrator complex subunit 11